MTTLSVHHTTVYRYARPVRFGEHRLMFRPRDSHDLRLIDTSLTISPSAEVRWLHDVFSNSIAIASFTEPAAELRFDSQITVEHYGLEGVPEFPLEPYARTYPFSYSSQEIPDLGRTIERHYPDPEGKIDAWVKGFFHGRSSLDTQALLTEMNQAIGTQFGYQRRYAVGTQTPVETLALGSGSCRDLALFMMSAARSLGLAARFVTGYLYDPALDRQGTSRAGGAGTCQPAAQPLSSGPVASEALPLAEATEQPLPVEPAIRGAGDTHAWVQIYLPGAGWVEFDPTNGLIGGSRLIRVGVARDPTQAIPLQGTYTGTPDDFLEMSVEVEVTRIDSEPPQRAVG